MTVSLYNNAAPPQARHGDSYCALSNTIFNMRLKKLNKLVKIIYIYIYTFIYSEAAIPLLLHMMLYVILLLRDKNKRKIWMNEECV